VTREGVEWIALFAGYFFHAGCRATLRFPFFFLFYSQTWWWNFAAALIANHGFTRSLVTSHRRRLPAILDSNSNPRINCRPVTHPTPLNTRALSRGCSWEIVAPSALDFIPSQVHRREATYDSRTSPMTNHHLLLACFLPAKRISRKHVRSPEGMVIWSIGSLGFILWYDGNPSVKMLDICVE
jgi:hypothetical protein